MKSSVYPSLIVICTVSPCIEPKTKLWLNEITDKHWIRKEFPLLQEVINDFFSQSDQNRSIVQSYNKTFDTNLELDILDQDPVIRSYFQTTSRDPSSKKTPPVEQKSDKVPTIDAIIHLTTDEQSKGNINNEENSYEDITAESTKASDKEQDTQKEKLEDLFIMTDNKQEKLKEIITKAVSSAVTSLKKRINDLESKNEELTTKIKELSELINSQNIQGDIKQTTEKR